MQWPHKYPTLFYALHQAVRQLPPLLLVMAKWPLNQPRSIETSYPPITNGVAPALLRFDPFSDLSGSILVWEEITIIAFMLCITLEL